MKNPPNLAQLAAHIEPNLVDKVITYFDPRRGSKRMAARGMMALAGGAAGGYAGAKVDRASVSTWRPGGGSPAEDIIRDLPMLRERSRDAARNVPVGTGAINSTTNAVVGTGLSCNPTINAGVLGMTKEAAQEWQEKAKFRFEAWAASRDCDVERDLDFYGLQDLALRTALESGDAWAITPLLERGDRRRMLCVQVIEADRVCNPNKTADTETLQDGCVIDANTGEIIKIHISRHHPGALARTGNTWTEVNIIGSDGKRRNVLHVWEKLRAGQKRGVPMLAPILEPLKQLGRWTDNELAAAVTSSLFSLFVKMDAEAFQEVFEEDAQEALIGGSKWSGSLDNGKAVRLLPGEEIQTAAMNRPNPEFDPFWVAMVRQIGMAIQIPYEVLVMHFQSSYSAARGALLLAWRFYRKRRDLLAKQICQPVYELWLEEEVATGAISAPGFFSNDVIRAAWCGAVWTGDGPGSIDPEKEVRAASARVDMGISTLEAESLAFDGQGWEAKHDQRVREVEARRRDRIEATAPAAAAPAVPDGSQQDPSTDPTDPQQADPQQSDPSPPMRSPSRRG